MLEYVRIFCVLIGWDLWQGHDQGEGILEDSFIPVLSTAPILEHSLVV